MDLEQRIETSFFGKIKNSLSKIKYSIVGKFAVFSLAGFLSTSIFSYGCAGDEVGEHKTDTDYNSYVKEDSYVSKDTFQPVDIKFDTEQPEKYCEFKCDNGKLIPQEWTCDGKYDCCEDEYPYDCDVFEDESVGTCGESCEGKYNYHKGYYQSGGGCCTEGWELSACLVSYITVNSQEKYPDALAYDGKYLWFAERDYLNEMSKNAKIFKIGPNFGEILNSFDSPDEYIPGLAWDGQHLWCSGWYTDRIYELDTNGKVVSSFSQKNLKGLAWDGEHLWVVRYYDNGENEGTEKIHKITTTGEVVESFDISQSYHSLAWDGQYFWAMDNFTVNKLAVKETVETVGYFNYWSGSSSLTWVGEHLWIASHNTYKYAINNTAIDSFTVKTVDEQKCKF